MRPSTGAREAAVHSSGFQLTSPVLHEEHDEVIDLFILLARIGVVQAFGGWDISGGAVRLARGRHSDSCDGCEIEHHVGDSDVVGLLIPRRRRYLVKENLYLYREHCI
jgi:hypothetical protein